MDDFKDVIGRGGKIWVLLLHLEEVQGLCIRDSAIKSVGNFPRGARN